MSVPSALNLAYVEQIPEMSAFIEGRAARQPTLRHAVSDNEAFRGAREHGYDAVAVASGFEEVAPRQADVYVDSGNLNEFEISLLTSTFAGAVVNAVAPDFGSGQLRERIHEPGRAAGDRRDSRPAAGPRLRPRPGAAPADGAGRGRRAVVVPLTDTWFADSPGERGEDQTSSSSATAPSCRT